MLFTEDAGGNQYGVFQRAGGVPHGSNRERLGTGPLPCFSAARFYLDITHVHVCRHQNVALRAPETIRATMSPATASRYHTNTE